MYTIVLWVNNHYQLAFDGQCFMFPYQAQAFLKKNVRPDSREKYSILRVDRQLLQLLARMMIDKIVDAEEAVDGLRNNI